MLNNINLKLKSIQEVFSEADKAGIVVSVEEYTEVFRVNGDYKRKADALKVDIKTMESECTPEMIEKVCTAYVKSMAELQKDYDKDISAVALAWLDAHAKQCKEGQGKDGQCKDGQCKDGQCKDGQGKDGQGKDGQCKDGQCKDTAALSKASFSEEVSVELIKAEVVLRMSSLFSSTLVAVLSVAECLKVNDTDEARSSAKALVASTEDVNKLLRKYMSTIVEAFKYNDLKLIIGTSSDAESVTDSVAESKEPVQTENKEEHHGK